MLKEKLMTVGLVVLGFMVIGSWGGAATQLDTTFGKDGFALQDFGIGDDEVFSLAVQSDGKIVAAGYSFNGAVKNLAVARFLEDGTKDVDFSNDGLLTLSMGNGDTVGRSVFIQDDGKIILAGSVRDDTENIVVLRLTPEGNLDPSFAVDGQLLVAVNDGEVENCDITLVENGSIVVAGTVGSETAVKYAVFVKLDPEGSLDESFGVDGVSVVKGSYDVTVNAIDTLPDGSILAGGILADADTAEAGTLRLTQEGILDSAYGTEGKKIVIVEGAGSEINDILIEEDGNVLLVGAVDNGNYLQAFVARISENGSYVSDFGESGLYRSSLGYENVANAVVLQSDASILVAGFAATETGKDIFLLTVTETQESAGEDQVAVEELDSLAIVKSAMLLEEGEEVPVTEDTEVVAVKNLVFSYSLTDVAEKDDVGYAVAILPDGNVLAAGSTENGNDMDFAVVRYSKENIIQSSNSLVYGNAVVTEGFRVLTAPVTNVTRVSAVSGGIISENSTLSCETGCTQECEDLEDEECEGDEECVEDSTQEECYDACLLECESKPTIELRGVVFSVTSLPSYNVDEGETDGDGGATVSEDEDTPTSFLGNNSAYEGDMFSYDIIRSGQTEDGSGTGAYSSEVAKVSPDVTYYVRAYAVLSDGTVIYGNQVMFKSNDACFIATAAYGSLIEKKVALLREFRDTYLRGSRLGERFIGVYYHVSPQIADFVVRSEISKAIVRLLLLPFVFIAWFAVKATVVVQAGVLAGIIGLAGLVLLAIKKNQVMSR